jgi:hypothetical protein
MGYPIMIGQFDTCADIPRSTKTTSLDPFFLCRVPALPLETVQALSSPALARHSENRLHLRAEVLSEQSGLLTLLYDLIGASRAPGERKALINLRRAVYRLRLPTRAASPVGHELEPRIEKLRRLLEQQSAADQAYSAAWHAEYERSRAGLLRTLANAEVRKGIAASAPDLHVALKGYDDSVGRPGERSRDRKRERAYLRYLTRAATKATPFGRFCTVLPGAVVAGDREFGVVGDLSVRESHVRLNKKLFSRIIAVLLAEAEARRSLPLSLDETLRLVDGAYWFMTLSNGREVLQRLDVTPATSAIIPMVRSAGTTTLVQLEQMLAAANRDADSALIEAYADTLLQIGLLRPQLGIDDNESEWGPQLLSVLTGMEGVLPKQIRNVLEGVIDEYATFGTDSIVVRARTQQSAVQAFRGLEELCGARLRGERDVIAYEDMTAAANIALPLTDGFERAIQVIGDYARITASLTPIAGEHRNVALAFRHLYGSDALVPLIRFYEDYYRRESDAAAKSADQEHAAAGQPTARSITRLVAELWRSAVDQEEIDISLASLDDAAGCRTAAGLASWEISVFGNILADTDRLLVSGGRYYAGYGKYYSRFLHMVPAAGLRHVRHRNAAPHGLMLAEIGGDDDFNANLHPPMTDWVIEYPTAGTPKEGVGVLRVAELVIRPAGDLLELVHLPTGSRVVPLDLGFLSPSMRPPLFRLLAAFAPPARFGLPMPFMPAGMIWDGSRTVIRPRITLGQHVVVSRRQWAVPLGRVPRRAGGESWDRYSMRLDDWRLAERVPARIFARVQQHERKDTGHRRPRRRFAHKPQYVDFNSPLFVHLFTELAQVDGPGALVLEEELPAATDCFSTEIGTFNPELVLQIRI